MADDIDELTLAGKLCMDAGYDHAAFILGREHAKEHQAKRKPRRRAGTWVKLPGGSWACLDSEKIREAEKRE
jgi:hypothetical protein